LVGLDMPPQMVATPKQALPTAAAPSNVSFGNAANANQSQMADLINLYQEAAFSDPVLNAARFNYQASKELYWQGLSLLLPQANATPGGTRYYQHGQGATTVATAAGNSRVFDQKSYTVTLTQPVFNMAALEAFKQGDLNTKIADMRFYLAQQDLINYFNIRKGQKLMQPNFGTVIWDMLFEPLDENTRQIIQQDIQRIVGYDPRLKVGQVLVTQQDTGFLIQLTLSYVNTNQVNTLNLNFDQNSKSLSTN